MSHLTSLSSQILDPAASITFISSPFGHLYLSPHILGLAISPNGSSLETEIPKFPYWATSSIILCSSNSSFSFRLLPVLPAYLPLLGFILFSSLSTLGYLAHQSIRQIPKHSHPFDLLMVLSPAFVMLFSFYHVSAAILSFFQNLTHLIITTIYELSSIFPSFCKQED